MAVATPSPSSIIAASAALSALCIVAVIMRFWARVTQRARFLIDDWLIIPALILTVGMGIALIVGVRLKALGYPTAPGPSGPKSLSHQAVVSLQLEWAIQMMQVLALGAVKLSFVFLFRRIFVVNKSSNFAVATLTMIIIISVWTVAFFFAFLFACGKKFSAWWSPYFRTECIGLDFENGFALSDFLMDVLILSMPLSMIWQLHMTTARKIGVTGVFAFGLLAVIASIIRLAIFYHAKYAAFKKGTDNDLLVTTILFWSMVESQLALLALCLPVLHSLFRRISLESVINSVRSIASLGSGSRRSPESRSTINDVQHGNESTASHARMVPIHGDPPRTVESIAMKDLSSKNNDKRVPQGEIGVNTTLTQNEDMA